MHSSHNENSKLLSSLVDNLLRICGFPSSKQKESKEEEDNTVKEILSQIKELNLPQLPKANRIYLIDTAVKAGNLEVVKTLTEKFIINKLDDDIRIPSKENPEHAYRPTFWLASIVTRYQGKEKYQAIESYLCNRLRIPSTVEINGKSVTRKDYLAKVDKWKHENNVRLMTENNAKKPRFPRHELMDSIQNFNRSSLKSPKK